ncbi:MAG: hypothetical protein AAF707_02330, partial [Pseudomonadota bacterium]
AQSDFGQSSPGEIVVQGQRLRGQLDVPQEPLLELSEEDIAAEGVSAISDLIESITDQTGSARGRGDGGGRPIILVNGIRVGSFRELANYPPEALTKVEVFPEEVALRFGFPPDRRVINLILKENYASREVELEFEGPARGGSLVNEQELGYLRINDGGRLNLNFTANDVSLLTEAERDLDQVDGSTSRLASDPDPAEFRSLIPDSRTLEANVSWAKAVIDTGATLSGNVNYERRDSRSLDGLNVVTLTDPLGESLTRTFGEESPLERRQATDVLSSSGSFARRVNAFQLTSTFNASLTETETEIDRPFSVTDLEALQDAAMAGTLALDGPLPSNADKGFDIARSRTIAATSLTTLRGPLADLPGGELLATFDVGYNWTNLETADTRSLQQSELRRGDLSTGMNLVVPITSTRTGFGDAIGSLTFNAQIGLQELSDFGMLGDYTLGLNWQPVSGLDLSATYIEREVAPGLASLGAEQITTFNVPVFDLTTGDTVLVAVTTGGNPDLLQETQRDWKFGVNWQVPWLARTRFSIEYIRNRSSDVVAGFPQVTPEIEAAFPDRVTRDDDGTLVALDRRSVTFAETRADRLQFRLSTRGRFGSRSGSSPRGAAGARPGPARPSARANGETVAAGAPSAGVQAGPQADGQANGPGAGGRRAAFMALREKLCAPDGLEFLTRLASAVEQGEDISSELPGFNAERLARVLERARNSDGELTPEALAAFRERLCSVDPSMMRGPRGEGRPGRSAGGGAPEAQTGMPGAEAPPDGAPGSDRRAQLASLQARLCGEDGLAAMRELAGKIERGEDVSAIIPGVDTSFLQLALDRARGPDGSIAPEAFQQFQARLCEAGVGSPAGPPGASETTARGGGGGPNRAGMIAAAFSSRRSGWRYFFNLVHTIELENEILIAPGIDVLDQLDGDGTGTFGFPRHSSELQAGLFGQGIGFRLSGRYTGTTRLDGSSLPESTDLFFDDLVTFDLRMFANMDQLTGSKSPLLKNLRVSLRADNIFDGQRAVRAENGETPVNFQPFLIDPVGRFVGIDIRKLF